MSRGEQRRRKRGFVSRRPDIRPHPGVVVIEPLPTDDPATQTEEHWRAVWRDEKGTS